MGLAQLVLATTLAIQPDAGLRVVNPHDVAIDAIVRCASRARVVPLEAYGVADLAATELCAAPQLETPLPLLAFETLDDAQRLLTPDAACPAPAMAVPLFGCERGTATALVPLIEGATYAWSAEGATIVSGQGTPVVKLELSSDAFARITVLISSPVCNHAGSGIIAIRKPLSFELNAPAEVDAGESVTVGWSYAAGSVPVSQVLKGNALAAPVVLPAAQRSYTFTPVLTGVNTIELVASYAPSIPIAPPSGKRRSAGSTRAVASNCVDARVVKQVMVGGCDRSTPAISMLPQVEAGTIVTASIPATRADAAQWFVENGTIVSGGESDTVRVLVPETHGGELSLRVRITRGETCVVESSATAEIVPRAVCPANPPTAAVTFLSRTCRTATVQAAFTGTPPFRGQWSDGTAFETSLSSITKTFTTAGKYTIGDFIDARCRGTVTSTAELKSFYPSVVVTSEDSCTETKVTATFTGKPPFKGRFFPGEWFETSEPTLTMQMPPNWTRAKVEHLTDAWCPEGGQGASSNEVQLDFRRHARMEPADLVCVSDITQYVTVFFNDGVPPWTVKWSDGVVSTGTQYNLVSRPVTTTKWADTLEIVEAFDGRCELLVDDRVLNVSYRPRPRIARKDAVVCAGKTAKILLEPQTMHPDTILTWTGKNGAEIVSVDPDGVTVKNARPGWTSSVRVTATFPDASCGELWYDELGLFGATEAIVSDFKVTPSTIKAGGTATITFKRAGTVEYWSLSTTESARYPDIHLAAGVCEGDTCSYTYADTHGPGNVTLKLYYGGSCNWSNPPLEIPLTITP